MKKIMTVIICAVMVITATGCKDLPELFSDGTFTEKIISTGFYAIELIKGLQINDVVTVDEYEIEDTPIGYDELSSEQKKIYRIMLTMANEMTEGFVNIGKTSVDYISDLAFAYHALIDDNPEIFWLPNFYLIGNTGTERKPFICIAFDYSDKDQECRYTVDKNELPQKKAELEKAVKTVLDGVKSGSEYEKELYIHDYLCDHITYETSDDAQVYTSYGALVNGKAVCSGYTKAMKLLCDRVGIPCYSVYGEAEEGHIWNVVCLEKEWYNVDLTWDDIDGTVHNYFNCTDEFILSNHSTYKYADPKKDKAVENGNFNFIKRECNQTEYNYFVYSGYLLYGDFSEGAERIFEADQRGEKRLQLLVNDKNTAEKFINDYASAASEVQEKLDGIKRCRVQLSYVAYDNNIVTFYWE